MDGHMKIPIYQVDAFTSQVFSGNPAAVCLLENWLDDSLLQAIAAENNLSETAFLVRSKDGFDLRWFTPLVEVDLCGHATLASACVLFDCKNWPDESIRFQTRKSGQLAVTKHNGFLEMDFPKRPPVPMELPEGLTEALGIRPKEVLGSEEDLLVVLEREQSVRDLIPDISGLARMKHRGIIVTARGQQCDFVSRFFAPRFGIPEDPVTGSAHCVLIPYWAEILAKQKLHAFQVSKRGGELFCSNHGKRVHIAGRAVLFLEGMISL